jgi:hypothetical protein
MDMVIALLSESALDHALLLPLAPVLADRALAMIRADETTQ